MQFYFNAEPSETLENEQISYSSCHCSHLFCSSIQSVIFHAFLSPTHSSSISVSLSHSLPPFILLFKAAGAEPGSHSKTAGEKLSYSLTHKNAHSVPLALADVHTTRATPNDLESKLNFVHRFFLCIALKQPQSDNSKSRHTK